jgi:hypothetical protein
MKRNKFSLSSHKLLTCDMGELVPINCLEVLPGDTIQQATSLLVRCTPLTSPPMHPVQVKVSHWFVPNRLIWKTGDGAGENGWEDFITGGEDGLDDQTFPTITFAGAVSAGDLADYFGIPLGTAGLEVNALPFRAYALIYNEWYRDTKLQTKLTIDTTDGADVTTSTTLKRCNWEKDYFVGAQDDTQLGTEVSLPLGTSAEIYSDNIDFDSAADDDNYLNIHTTDGTGALKALAGDGTNVYGRNAAAGDGVLKADLSNATAATINELREAIALQKYAEARQIYGSRYTEYLRYLGVKPSDSRLQRPEYLGGGMQTIQFSEVLSTDGANTGDMKGHGIGAMKSNRYRKFFEEHGFIISLMYVRPRTLYQQGLAKMWSRSTKEDFFQKELQHIGMDEVLNQEIDVSHASPAGTFGYRNRYDDYRQGISSVSGEFSDGEQYDHWHFGRVFAADPALNDTFITCTPPVDPFADQVNNQLLVMAKHSIQARRLLSKRGNPIGLI